MSHGSVKTFGASILAKGEITDEELLQLRRKIGKDFQIDEAEANLLFEINDTVKTPKGWSSYFINVISTYMLYQGEPKGYVTESMATWLRARIDHDGVVETVTELGLLLHLIKHAYNITSSLEKFALDQVGQAVMSGKGFIGRNMQLTPGAIGEAEIEILRKVLHGISSEGGISISRMEAEFLFDLNEATLSANNHPSWQRVFVQGIANHLMMLGAYEELDIEEARRLEKWENDPKAIGRIRDVTIDQVKEAFKSKPFQGIFDKNEYKTDHRHMNELEAEQAERITRGEADWLIERLNRDNKLDVNEEALLAFLAVECPMIHSSLQTYIKAA